MSLRYFDPHFWRGRKVFLTGHTGFKGGWLSLWLQKLGAELTGYSLCPPTSPSLFEVANIRNGMVSHIADIRELSCLRAAIKESSPEIIIHLAAQSLVRHSYDFPVETYSTNVMGTVNLLESARGIDSVRSILIITTDKVYKNREWIWPYRENEELGGHDPYSNSKACTELAVQAYKDSFFRDIAISTARAGNVIGGGDWSADRLLPDLIKAFRASEKVQIRNPNSIRPWQHVLEPLYGYLKLAQVGYEFGNQSSGAWNFGPAGHQSYSVKEVADLASSFWGGTAAWMDGGGGDQRHESQILKLDSTKADLDLNWRSILSVPQGVNLTVNWAKKFQSGEEGRKITIEQIEDYESLLASHNI